MIRSWLLAALLALFMLCGCGRWKTVQDNDSGAIGGQTKFILLPLSFDAALIDGDPQPKWFAAQDAEQKTAWPSELDYIQKAFRRAAGDAAGEALHLTTSEAPDGATVTLKPAVTELESGGYSKVVMTVNLQVLDAKGALLEEITTRTKANGRDEFKTRIAAAADTAGDNVGRYLKKRAGK